jgi:MFS transporter, FHS family, Na+ dependent glucose transporter 1
MSGHGTSRNIGVQILVARRLALLAIQWLQVKTLTSIPGLQSSKNHRHVLIELLPYLATAFSVGSITAVFGPTLLALAENTATSLGNISILFSILGFSVLLGNFLGGYLYERFKPNIILALFQFILSAMLLLIPMSATLGGLLLVVFVLGLGAGLLDLGANTLLLWKFGEKVGPYMAGLHLCFGIGAFIAPIIVAQTLHAEDGLRLAYWLLAFLTLPIGIALLRSTSTRIGESKPDHHENRARPAQVILVALFLMFYVGTEASFGGWLYTYATRLNLTTDISASYLTSSFWGAFTFARLVSIPLASRFKAREILLGSLSGAILCIVSILVFPASTIMLWIGTIGLGISFAALFPLMLTFAGNHMPISSRTTSWFFIGSSIGGMLVPWLAGQVFENFGLNFLGWVILGGVIFLVLTLALLLRTVPLQITSQRQIQP